MKNKILIWTTSVSMLLLIALFAYFNTFESDAGALRTNSFPTITPTPDLVGTGWWNTLPTPIPVETRKP